MKAFENRRERSGRRTKNFEIREGKRCALLGGVRQFFRRKIAKRWRAEREANAVHQARRQNLRLNEVKVGVPKMPQVLTSTPNTFLPPYESINAIALASGYGGYTIQKEKKQKKRAEWCEAKRSTTRRKTLTTPQYPPRFQFCADFFYKKKIY